MQNKNVKNKIRFAIHKRREKLSTNIFQYVKRHSDGVYLVLQDGLEAELINENEIMIIGSPICVTFDSSDGPARQKTFIPASAEAIRTSEANLQHLACERGLSSDDRTGIRHHEAHAIVNK